MKQEAEKDTHAREPVAPFAEVIDYLNSQPPDEHRLMLSKIPFAATI